MSAYLFELDLIKPKITKTISDTIIKRTNIAPNPNFISLPTVNKLIEIMIKRYLCAKSDEINDDVYDVIDEVTYLADKGYYNNKHKLAGCSTEPGIEHSDRILALMEDSEVATIYSVLLKATGGSLDSATNTLMELFDKVLPKDILDKDERKLLADEIVDAILIAEDSVWIDNLSAIEVSQWTIYHVNITDNDVFISALGDYRVEVWKFHKALRELRCRDIKKIPRDAIAEIDSFDELSEEAKPFFKLQLLANTNNGKKLTANNFSHPSMFLDEIPMHIRAEISQFVAKRYY